MSQVKGTEIAGDVAVERHIVAGGDAIVRGNARVNKNLRVEGWLEARNIKGSDKGMYESLSALEAHYPNPEDGWWALVGKTFPARVYAAQGGKWTLQRNPDGSEATAGPAVDLVTIEERIEEIRNYASGIEDSLMAFRSTKAQVNGLASLNSHGVVPENQLLHPAIYFSGLLDPDKVEDLRIGTTADHKLWEEQGGELCVMVYHTGLNRLLLRIRDELNGGSDGYIYLRTWTDCWRQGERHNAANTVPYANRLYIDVTTGTAYYWGSERLVSLTASIERALAGDKEKITELSGALKGLLATDRDHDEKIADLDLWINNVDEFTNELRGGLEVHAEQLTDQEARLQTAYSTIHMLGYRLRESERERERLESELRTLGATCTDSESGLWSGRAIWHDDELWRDEAWSADAAVAELDSRLTAAIEDVKLRDLIAQWMDATTMYRGNNSTKTSIGDYDKETGLFTYAGKITLTEEEVRLMFVEQFTGAPVSCANAYRDKWWLPAVLPLRVRASTSLADTFSSCRQLKIIVFDGYHEALSVTSLSNTFYNCRALRFIAGDPLEVSQIKNYGSGTFGVCEKLEEVWIQGLNASISFSACRMLKRECLKYLLDYAVNEVQISITVHPDVYARITGDMTNTAVTELSDAERTEWAALLPLAQAKNIMFATV
ncbi:MAG: hypothetical protein HDS66_01490 [Bacteroidales bacterium]|nr:hypothetical protein [Bacteroidales bacterium]